jgi:nucleoside-triphosphatase THEP1
VRGVGKSTVCSKTVALAQAHDHNCGGVLTLSQPGEARDVLDVRTGHVRRMTLQSDASGADYAVVQGRFRFDPETLTWGNETLAHAPPCDLLVVDELGPLEIERGKGWQKAFDVLRGNDFTLALVVVRPELLAQAQRKLSSDSMTVVTVEMDNRDDLPDLLLNVLERS